MEQKTTNLNTERSEAEWKEMQQRIREVERQLLNKNRNWTPEKANFMAKKLLCLTY